MDRLEEALKTYIAIKRTNNRMTDAAKADVTHHGLNINEFAVLEVLYHKGPQRIQHIKEKILIASSSTTYIIDKLADKGYIDRVRDQVDRRIYYAQLTRSGEQVMDEIFPGHEKMILNLFDRMEDQEIYFLKELLKKMNGYGQ
ncbi:transcriptional repressor MprA [Alloiococcus otitis]|uniref:HTH marR-type domain-containing protein n=1 Tax=Alloiococcus otitis ATCC 51267 TaxID=883081 RepID=K9EVD9_9LACT|nr:MarR family transcriptional regulator [Alloiococcus otitis]EKU93190.1 hypothetical protein HMPREF9698_01351 [Alloiococcus otitis ATCC 51267]SUU80528.1 transcriptional repressor MprA [Alloiococcus otitis]